MNLTLMHPQKHVRKKIMKACNYFQILHEGDVLPLLQVGKKVALMQIFFFIFCSFSFGFLQKLHRLRPENGSHRHINQFLHITEMKLLLFVRKKHHIKAKKNDPILTKNSSKSTTLSEQFGCMPIIMKQFSTFFVFGLWYLILLIVV